MMSNKEFKEQFKKRLFAFSLRLVRYAKELPWQDPVLKVGRDQVIRSGTSMGANYFESIAGSSKRDFANFNSYSLKSANETVFWLSLLEEYLAESSAELSWLIKETEELARIFGSIVVTSKDGKKEKE